MFEKKIANTSSTAATTLKVRIAELSEINLRLGEEKYALRKENAKLKQENATLRADAELVERAGAVKGVFIQQNYCQDDWVVIRADSTERFDTLREALEALGEKT